MSTTLSMWLGISFVALAIIASALQAWLWSFPMEPDPGGPDPHGKTTAPAFGRYMHRAMGFAYVIIYVVLMIEMVPRLWEYQFELPARTVMHATMGIIIGVLLVTKIGILRWWNHFGGALPAIGLSLLACTIVLATLSVPFALRAHDFGEAATPENLARVKKQLAKVEFSVPVNLDRLASESTFQEGQTVLTGKCVLCHDIRTILNKPRTAKQWHSVVRRMVKKPTLGPRLTDSDVVNVTSYLVAITPDIVDSGKLKKDVQQAQAKRVAEVKSSTELATKKTEGDPSAPQAAPKPSIDTEAAKALYDEKCTECHETDTVDEHGKDDLEGWTKVVNEMVEEGAELSDEEAKTIIGYLVATRGK